MLLRKDFPCDAKFIKSWLNSKRCPVDVEEDRFPGKADTGWWAVRLSVNQVLLWKAKRGYAQGFQALSTGKTHSQAERVSFIV